MLAVATLEPRKNLPRWSRASGARGSTCELRIAGDAGWGDVDVGGDRVRRLGRVDDEELAALYRGARCLVYPSTYEGFGLPVLEAMAAGTRGRSARRGRRTTSSPRASPSRATRWTPTRSRRRCARRSSAATSSAERGRERAAEFTWERTARGTVDVYREVAA